MKKFFLFTLLLSLFVNAQVKVTFLVSVKSEIKSKVYVTGNHSILGFWNPSLVELQKINDSTFSQSFFFSKNIPLEFKITAGSWDREAIYEDGKVPSNFSLLVEKDTTLSITVLCWKNEKPKLSNDFKGQITGKVEYIHNLSYKNLLPRDVIIWLPPEYGKNKKQRFPVLYMHDGQNIIDPATSFAKIDWQIDETVDSLIKNKIIEPMIIVGIYNTTNRMREYTPGKEGEEYCNFIVKELKPLIDKKYRTIKDKEHTSTGGSSAGGLISFMLLWNYSNVFSKAICMSPAFKIETIDFVSTVLNYKGKKKNIKVYIDNGGFELENLLQPGIDEMLSALKQKGYVEGKDFSWYKDENAYHTESEWAKRLWRPLTFLFGKE